MRDSIRHWSTSSRRLGALFLLVLVPAAATLLWLGVRLIAQDRQLWTRRDVERREAAAEIVVRGLAGDLATIPAAIESGIPPMGAVLVTLNDAGVTVRPRDRVLWMPVAPALPEANTSLFSDAEVAEIRQIGDRGLAVYRKSGQATDSAIRAGALQRLARVQRTSGDIAAALETYRDLARTTTIGINHLPADLVARRAICELLAGSHDTASLAREATALRDDLLAGRWTLDEVGWTLTADDVERWTNRPVAGSEDRVVSGAIDWLWHEQHDSLSSTSQVAIGAGRKTLRVNGAPVFVQWQPGGSGTLAALVVPMTVVTGWMRRPGATDATGLLTPDAVILSDDSGAIALGAPAETGSRLVTRLAAETGLPWNVMLKPDARAADTAEFQSRSTLLWAGLGAIVILLSGGSYILWRTVRREMAVARMQTDFVAAVSHEFRTPLTSLQHVTELLDEDDHLPPEDKRALYSTLGRNTHRLRGLVESLLDFSRMEDGRRPYDLQPVDPSMLVRDVILEFERQATPGQIAITQELAPAGSIGCRVDTTALRHAVWNLLDNAVKYSPTPHQVRVSVQSERDEVAIVVADRGFGIPADERQTIFEKFVRGGDTARRGIKGTGLGLAMVTHIVAAHRGRIELESEVGQGSTFTVRLPCQP